VDSASDSNDEVKAARKEVREYFLNLASFADDELSLSRNQRKWLDQWAIDAQIAINDLAAKVTRVELQAGAAIGRKLGKAPESPLVEAVVRHANVTTATDHSLSGIVSLDLSDVEDGT
jgi:hypothetical protein